jgi:hypothetical protein
MLVTLAAQDAEIRRWWFEASQANSSRNPISKISNTKKGLEVWVKC